MEGLGIRIPAGTGVCSLLQNLRTGSVAHPTSYSLGTRSFFCRVKRTGSVVDLQLAPRSRMCETRPLIPLYAFMARTEITLPLLLPIKLHVAHKSYCSYLGYSDATFPRPKTQRLKMIKQDFFSVVLHGHNIWSLTLNKAYGYRMFKKRVTVQYIVKFPLCMRYRHMGECRNSSTS